MIKLIMFACKKISYKDKQQTSFLCYIYVNLYREISNQQLGRKYKALQGIVMEQFVFSLSFSIAENNGKHLGKCIFQHSRREQIFLTPQLQGTSWVTKYITNGMPENPWVQHCKYFSKLEKAEKSHLVHLGLEAVIA